MKRPNLAYILLVLLAMPLINSCDKAPKERVTVMRIVKALEGKQQQYFNVEFEIAEINRTVSLYQLNGTACLKTGKYGSISKAFFTLQGEDKLHYLHTISDLNEPLYVMESNELEESAAAYVYDSINSPVLLQPQLLNEWLTHAKNINIIDNKDKDIINIEFNFDQKRIKLIWDNKEQNLSTLEMINDSNRSYRWKYTYLNELAYENLLIDKKLKFALQKKEFL